MHVLQLNDANATAQHLELHKTKCLRHDVGEPILSAHEL
jgi:hypothetical protein